MKKIVLIVIATLTVAMLAGCNTVSGMGKDIKSGGAAIERAGGK